MANLADIPFHSLNDDDLFDVLRSLSSHTEVNNNPSGTAYDNSVSNNINSRSQELEFHLDHDLVQSPSSEYVTVNQF